MYNYYGFTGQIFQTMYVLNTSLQREKTIGNVRYKMVKIPAKRMFGLVKIKIKDDKAIAYPKKIRLMPYFIKRMIRKRISYVEDSFKTPSQESIISIKPFLITRKKVSKAVRKALRNRCKNWIEDYISEKTDQEIFNEVLSNKIQRTLSLVLKKTYPLSLCEIRILEIIRPLKPEEIPEKKKITKAKEQIKQFEEEIIDQVAELEKEKKEKAEEEIKKTQKKAAETEKKTEKKTEDKQKPKKKETKEKPKKSTKTKETKNKA